MSSVQAEIEICLKEYEKQKKLEMIVNQRQLHRPSVKKWQVVLLFSIVPILFSTITFVSLILPIVLAGKILVFTSLLFVTIESYIRFCIFLTIKCYQRYAKEETRKRCKCVPSCSEYALLCLSKVFPLILALIKIRRRLYKTCDGEEYKLDYPFEKMNREFEEKYIS